MKEIIKLSSSGFPTAEKMLIRRRRECRYQENEKFIPAGICKVSGKRIYFFRKLWQQEQFQ
jgi:hypothetical protein